MLKQKLCYVVDCLFPEAFQFDYNEYVLLFVKWASNFIKKEKEKQNKHQN